MDQVDVGVGLIVISVLESFCVLFQLVVDEVIVDLPLVAVSQQLHLLVLYEIVDTVTRPVPVLLALGFQHHPLLVIRDEDGLPELLLF